MDFGQDVDEIVRLTKWIMTHAPERGSYLATQEFTIFGVALDVLEAQRCRLNMLQQSFDALTEHKKEKK
jgi:hypothetical protein